MTPRFVPFEAMTDASSYGRPWGPSGPRSNQLDFVWSPDPAWAALWADGGNPVYTELVATVTPQGNQAMDDLAMRPGVEWSLRVTGDRCYIQLVNGCGEVSDQTTFFEGLRYSVRISNGRGTITRQEP